MDSNFEVFWYGVIAFLIMFIPIAFIATWSKRKIYGGRFRRQALFVTLMVFGSISMLYGLGKLAELLSVVGSRTVIAEVTNITYNGPSRYSGQSSYLVIIKDGPHPYTGRKLAMSSYSGYVQGSTVTIRVSENGDTVVGNLAEQTILASFNLLVGVGFLAGAIGILRHKKESK